MSVGEAGLRELLASRLDADGTLPADVRVLVVTALDGPAALDALLTDGELPEPPKGERPALDPVPAYITSLSVEGFRGVGARATLTLAPGPGLTLVIGRNGSGKSSFAEALEVLFTGDNRRWATRSAVWKEGWRNLHHPVAAIEATLAVEGIPGATVVHREWPAGATLDASRVEVQPMSGKKTDLSYFGWESALTTYRPFLSYNELGAMFDEGPTKMHDAVSVVLGLEELPAAEKALKDARLAREKAQKAVLAAAAQIGGLLEELDDERARSALSALTARQPQLDVIERLVSEPTDAAGPDELAVLSRVCAITFPSAAEIDGIVQELQGAQADLAEVAGTEADRLLQSAALLEQAVSYHAAFHEANCPVCGTEGVLDDRWLADATSAAADQRKAAHEARQAKTRFDRAVAKARELVTSVPMPVQSARPLLDVAPIIEAWREWVAVGESRDVLVLAGGLSDAASAVRTALSELQSTARVEVERRQDAWRPVAFQLARWLADAREAQAAARAVPELKQAEKWLKENSTPIRNERFAPIAEEAMSLWTLLRQRSNVRLGRIELSGAGVKRRVTLDVTVDGMPGAALGVMSQGELHALALSLFLPRATLDESPFRFVALDDPVQSMDPSKVDGLAKVLERAAGKRQVIVYTHDDRLPEAIRRLGIDATVIEVSRGEESAVELRPALTPVERHLEDAHALVRAADLPPSVAARVVPGFCRLALDAACIDAIRRRRIGRGEAHAAVEDLLSRVNRTTVFASLALFDDGNRGGDVLGTIDSRFGRQAAEAFQGANQAVHAAATGELRDLVRDVAPLARNLAECE